LEQRKEIARLRQQQKMADRAREEEESAKIIPPEGEDYGPNSCVPNQGESSSSFYRTDL